MIIRIIGDKAYRLEKMHYDVVDGAEVMYLGFEVTQDIEFGTRTYHAGFNVTTDELALVMATLESSFADYIVYKLTSENI